jgi:uncharacterized small protein (DUF1192 family)
MEASGANQFLAKNWSIVIWFVVAVFTAGGIFAEFTSLKTEVEILNERLDKKIKLIGELEDRILALEKEVEFEKGYLKGKEE